MYEHNNASEEYFKENDQKANRVTCYFIYVVTFLFPILFLLTRLNIIHTPGKSLQLPFILTIIFDIALILLRLFKAPSSFIKY